MQLHALIIALVCIMAVSSILPDKFGEHIRKKRMLIAPIDGEESPLPRHVTPVGYHVWLLPFPPVRYYEGRVDINISCHTPTKTISLHAGRNLNITKAYNISVIGVSGSFGDYREVRDVSVVDVLRRSRDTRCDVKLSDYLQQGVLYQLKIEFASYFRNESCDEALYFGYYSDNFVNGEADAKDVGKDEVPFKRWFVATNLKRNKAREVFPCFDELSYKAPFVITIGRLAWMRSLSNMALQKSTRRFDQPGLVWDTFEMTPPISTISVIFFIFEPDVIVPLGARQELGSTTLHMYAPVELKNDLQIAYDKMLQVVKEIEMYLQMKYPLPDLQIVVVPGLQCSSEGFGLSLHSAGSKAYLWPFLFLMSMGDQWLVHLTTPHSWAETSFGNGLTTYVSHVGFTATIADQRSAEMYSWGSLYPDLAVFDPRASNSGFAVMRMLNYTFGENTLRSAFHRFLQDRLYDTFVSDDIVAAIEDKVQIHSALPEGVTVSKIVSSWMKTPQFPVVTVIRNYQTRTADIWQHEFTANGSSERREDLWYVPLMLLRSDQREGRSLEGVIWMKNERKITLENMPSSQNFIIVDPDIIGLYVVNYDPTNWKLISQHLKTKVSSLRLSAITRARLLTDAGLLANVGNLTYDVPFDLSLMLANENNLEPFNAFNEFFWDLHKKVKHQRMYDLLKEYIWKLFSPLYEKYGGFNEDKLLDNTTPQGIVTKIMCSFGEEECVQTLSAKYKPQDFSYGGCIALFWGERYIWEETLIEALGDRKNNIIDLKLLEHLASCTREEETIEKLLDTVVLKSSMSDRDILSVISMVRNPYPVFNFMSNKWTEIKKKYEYKPDKLEAIVSEITSKFVMSDGYDLVSDFYVARQRDMPSLLPVLRNSLQTITEHMKWTNRSCPQIESWIHQYVKEY